MGNGGSVGNRKLLADQESWKADDREWFPWEGHC